MGPKKRPNIYFSILHVYFTYNPSRNIFTKVTPRSKIFWVHFWCEVVYMRGSSITLGDHQAPVQMGMDANVFVPLFLHHFNNLFIFYIRSSSIPQRELISLSTQSQISMSYLFICRNFVLTSAII